MKDCTWCFLQLLAEETDRHWQRTSPFVWHDYAGSVLVLYLFLCRWGTIRGTLKDYCSILEQFFTIVMRESFSEPDKTDEYHDKLWKMRTIFDKPQWCICSWTFSSRWNHCTFPKVQSYLVTIHIHHTDTNCLWWKSAGCVILSDIHTSDCVFRPRQHWLQWLKIWGISSSWTFSSHTFNGAVYPPFVC